MDAFVEAASKKVTYMAWVRSFSSQRWLVCPTFEDENRWPTLPCFIHFLLKQQRPSPAAYGAVEGRLRLS
jgi:hypothetical protein